MIKVGADFIVNSYSKAFLILIFLCSFSSAFSQYGTFYSKERQIEKFPAYDQYKNVISVFNKNKNFDTVIEGLDNLANHSLKENQFTQFLFFKNELANLYKHHNKFFKSYNELVSGMESFKAKEDTLNIEYFVSLRLLRTTLLKIKSSPGQEDFQCRSQIELYQSMFDLLELLEEKGEPMRNTLVDYGMYLIRSDKKIEGINKLYRARGLALEAGDLASLAVADYTLLSSMETSFDLLKTKNEVLETDIEIFESKKASIPVLMYNAYFLTKVSQNYSEDFYNIEKAIEYATKAAKLLDTLKYPAHSIKAATHGNLAKYYALKGDTSKMWEHVKVARKLAETQPMSVYNRAFAYVLVAEAVETYAPDTTLAYLNTLDSLPGKKYFINKLVEIEAYASLNKGLANRAKELILKAFEHVEKIGGNDVPILSLESAYYEQYHLIGILQDIYMKLEEGDTKNYRPAIVDLIDKQNILYQKIMTEDIYGFEITSLAKQYNEFVQKNLPYLFNLPDDQYQKQRLRLALTSKGIHLNALMSKNKYQSFLENDTLLFSRLLKSSHKVQQSRNNLAKVGSENQDLLYDLHMELNNDLIDNLMLRYEIEGSMQNIETQNSMNIEMIDVSEIQSQLHDDEALIEYYVFDDSWAQLLVLPDTIYTFYHENEKILDKIDAERYAVLTGRESTDIGQTLLKKVKPLLNRINKLIIIPDANLNYIPFELLKLKDKMLIEDFSISYSYSSNSWYNLRKDNEFTTPQNILTIAPIFDDYDQKFNQLPMTAYRGEGVLKPLPNSLVEVEGIAKKIADAQISIKHLTGTEATIEAVKTELPDFDILHFSTHGLVNANYPERSGLYLYDNVVIDDEQKVSLLTLGELFNMKLNAQLMVLSACNTGRGDYQEGEGVMALPRGGILAGVPRVIASLWKVHDELTKNLMLDFYHYLAKGYSYRDALRLAKLDAIKNGVLPKDWAGFVLIGA